MSWRTIERTVFDGIANPTPSEPPDSLSICALTPITRPRRSRSGPPELPWLIAASVWIVSVMMKLFGAVISRWSALTIPARDRSLEPERAAQREDRVSDVDGTRVGEAERGEQAGGRVDADDGEVGGRIGADELGVELDAVPEAHRDRRGACDDVLVRHDVTVAVVDEAGSLRSRLRAAARGDLDDGLRRALVDRARREPVGRDRLRALDGDLTHDCGRAVVEDGERGGSEPEPEREGCDQRRRRRAECEGGRSSCVTHQCGEREAVTAERRVRRG